MLLLVEFGVLGPVSVWSDGHPISVGGPRQRCVLGALLVHLGHEVTVDQLIGYLWSDDPPRTARSVIQVQVSHLRQVLTTSITTTSGGYLLEVDPDSVDLHRFRRLRGEAAGSSPEAAVDMLDRALSCWRGVPLSGVGSEHLTYTVVTPLLEERWAAVTDWASNALYLERYGDVVARLTPLIRENPFGERLHHLLITALWRDNERARALAVYEEFRTGLAEELGVDPGVELVSLHTRILREDAQEELDVPSAAEPPGPTDRFVARNDLPRDLPDFTGRQGPLRRLKDVADSDTEWAQVCIITGSGGSGKTTTAVRFGHEIAKRYPDGQLFIDLYGYTAEREPLDPTTALGVLLRAVGFGPESVPESLDERSALWRAALMGKKFLLILDNANNYTQVSSLLPSAPDSLTLITTRNELSGLSGAHFVSLGKFDEQSSVEFFSRVLGEERVAKEFDQVKEIISICEGLPLALRIIAGRMLGRPTWTFSHVARRLGERNRKFRELEVDGKSVESVIDLSFQTLGPEQRRVFLLLGSMIGGRIDLGGAAALLGLPADDTDDVLQELVGGCLLEEVMGDVYRFHDLIGDFAAGRAEKNVLEEDVLSARGRLADYYSATAQVAADMLGPRAHNDTTEFSTRYRTVIRDREDAENWFDLNQENLVDAIEYFASRGDGEHAWRMAESVWRFYALRGKLGLLISSHERALRVSEAQGNHRGRAVTLIGLGIASYISGNFVRSLDFLTEAQKLLHELDDKRGIVRALANLGLVHERMGNFPESIKAVEGVLENAVLLEDVQLEVLQWGNLAVLRNVLGEHDEAIRCAEEALKNTEPGLQEEVQIVAERVIGESLVALGEKSAPFTHLNEALRLAVGLKSTSHQMYIHNSLGCAHRFSGDMGAAVESHSLALSLAESSGDHSGDAEILTDLGVTHTAAGQYPEAAKTLTRALALAEERDERYIVARARLALGRLPISEVGDDRARELLESAEHIFTDLGLVEADQAREALSKRFG